MHRFKDIELVKEDVNKKHLCKSLMVITYIPANSCLTALLLSSNRDAVTLNY